ncbi:hypothetical protein ACIRBX_07445 [Kitasatospora sp. NPDC096147]|uniref:hypothetical protein n=1 Tax=Kitasatospora sp. NPDC096147 TaxID=3364093 RepID=UPI0038183B1B
MAGEQFGVQLQELGRIQQDWQEASRKMAELQAKLGKIQSTLAKAVAVDLSVSPLAGIAGFAIAYDVLSDAKEVETRARHLMETKEKLSQGIAQDAEKIKSVIKEYTEAERKVHDEMKDKEKKQPPSTGIDGVGDKGSGSGGSSGSGSGGHGSGSGSGGGSGGDTGGGGGGGSTRPDGNGDHSKYKDHTTGDKNVRYINGNSWEDWARGKDSYGQHPRNGEGKGALVRPPMDGLSDERHDILERAMKRVDMKLGYSQGAITDQYRVDCSGFVSAAWGLPPGGYGGLNTTALMDPSVSERISKNDLKPGDALINNGHTILFGGWVDESHTKYIAIENASRSGTVSRVATMGTEYGFYRRKDL